MFEDDGDDGKDSLRNTILSKEIAFQVMSVFVALALQKASSAFNSYITYCE